MSDTKKSKKLMNRRTLGGVATLAVAAATLGVAVSMPNQGGGSSPKKTAASGATETVTAKRATDAKGISTKAGTGDVVFTFNSSSAGDCRRQYGATWKLSPNGHAYFKGRFWSSSGDDAWLMYAKLLDSRGGVIGYIRDYRNAGDSAKFVIGLPNAGELRTYGRNASFAPHLWDDVQYISLTRHC